MSATVVLISVFAIFIPALMLPGPDFIAVVRSAMTRGAAGGLLTTLGVAVCLGLYATLSMLGLSAVLLEYRWLAVTARVLGGCYLIYLGVRLLLAPRRDLSVAAGADRPRGNPLLFGFLVTATNPKAIVLFTSVFATAVTETTPLWLMALIVALVVASAAGWYALVSLFMASAPVMRRFGQVRHWIERAAGACFVAMGGRILADARGPAAP